MNETETYNPMWPNSSCNCVMSSVIPSVSLDEVVDGSLTT